MVMCKAEHLPNGKPKPSISVLLANYPSIVRITTIIMTVSYVATGRLF